MENKVNYKLKGHEKFPLREGWMNKGISAAKEDGTHIFLENQGADVLGVGTNMVKSIRYWMQACGLLERNGNKEKLSDMAEIIFEKDPYFEDVFSLWLLHSNIAKNIEQATVWYMFFGLFLFYCIAPRQFNISFTWKWFLFLQPERSDSGSRLIGKAHWDEYFHYHGAGGSWRLRTYADNCPSDTVFVPAVHHQAFLVFQGRLWNWESEHRIRWNQWSRYLRIMEQIQFSSMEGVLSMISE